MAIPDKIPDKVFISSGVFLSPYAQYILYNYPEPQENPTRDININVDTFDFSINDELPLLPRETFINKVRAIYFNIFNQYLLLYQYFEVFLSIGFKKPLTEDEIQEISLQSILSQECSDFLGNLLSIIKPLLKYAKQEISLQSILSQECSDFLRNLLSTIGKDLETLESSEMQQDTKRLEKCSTKPKTALAQPPLPQSAVSTSSTILSLDDFKKDDFKKFVEKAFSSSASLTDYKTYADAWEKKLQKIEIRQKLGEVSQQDLSGAISWLKQKIEKDLSNLPLSNCIQKIIVLEFLGDLYLKENKALKALNHYFKAFQLLCQVLQIKDEDKQKIHLSDFFLRFTFCKPLLQRISQKLFYDHVPIFDAISSNLPPEPKIQEAPSYHTIFWNGYRIEKNSPTYTSWKNASLSSKNPFLPKTLLAIPMLLWDVVRAIVQLALAIFVSLPYWLGKKIYWSAKELQNIETENACLKQCVVLHFYHCGNHFEAALGRLLDLISLILPRTYKNLGLFFKERSEFQEQCYAARKKQLQEFSRMPRI